MKLKHIHKEKVGALFFLMFTVVYSSKIGNIDIPFFAEEDLFTSRTMPYAYAFIGTILSLLTLIFPSGQTEKRDRISEVFKGLEWKPAFQMIILMMVYGVTIKLVGFIISTIIFLACGFWILGERRIKIILVSSIPIVIIFWYILSELLDVYLDPGLIFYFLKET